MPNRAQKHFPSGILLVAVFIHRVHRPRTRTVAAPPSIVVRCGGVVLRVVLCGVILVVSCVVLFLVCVCVCVCFVSHIIQLTPQQQSAEQRNSAGAEALAVAIRPKEASREKTRPPPVLRDWCV